jgi:hypothetical protein
VELSHYQVEIFPQLQKSLNFPRRSLALNHAVLWSIEKGHLESFPHQPSFQIWNFYLAKFSSPALESS